MRRPAFATVLLKELKDSLRDRRTALMVFVASVLTGPVTLVLVAQYISGIEEKAAIFKVRIAGQEHAPALVNFLQRNDVNTPTHDFNMVYVPYCTGDVHTGNNVIVYDDPLGEQASVTFHHAGHDNMQKVISWVDGQFTHVPRMLVTGCSAGGGISPSATRGRSPTATRAWRSGCGGGSGRSCCGG